MKIKSLSILLAYSGTIAVLLALPMNWASAKPGGVYKGKGKKNALKAVGAPSPQEFGAIPITLRVPDRKGKITGTFFLLRHAPPGPGNVPITGRVRKAIARQGGKKHIFTGKWTWNFVPAGAPGKATGPFKIVIKKIGNSYRFTPPEKVKVTSGAPPPAYSFTSKVSARK